MSPASTHARDQAGTRSKHKTLSVLRRLGRLSQDAELQREELLQEHGDVA